MRLSTESSVVLCLMRSSVSPQFADHPRDQHGDGSMPHLFASSMRQPSCEDGWGVKRVKGRHHLGHHLLLLAFVAR